MNVRYRVELGQAERAELAALLSGGKHSARKLKRAQILLAADTGVSDEDIAASVGVGGSTVYRTKRRFVLGNLDAALSEEPRPGASRKLSGKEEALLVATACSSPPAGRARWTLVLLADELVRLTEHKSLSGERVRRRPKTTSSPGARTCGAFPRSMANTSPAWKTCSTSMPKRLIPGDRWSASMKARSSSLVRCASQSRPSRASLNATIASTAATAPSISSSSSTSIVLGARSRSLSGGRQKITPNACANSSTSIIPMPNTSGWSRITCRPTRAAPPGLPARRSPPHFAPPGVPLHPQARQLAQHGRDRDRRTPRPVPGPQNRRPKLAPPRNRRLGTTTKRRRRPHQMDVHNRQSPRQNGPRLSRHIQRVIITVTRY